MTLGAMLPRVVRCVCWLFGMVRVSCAVAARPQPGGRGPAATALAALSSNVSIGGMRRRSAGG